jgi:hypothetical protein
VDKYGDRTANGIAGGLKGVETQLVVWRGTATELEALNNVAAATANVGKIRILESRLDDDIVQQAWCINRRSFY